MAESTNSSGKAAEISGGWGGGGSFKRMGSGTDRRRKAEVGSKGLKEWEAGEIGGGGG